MIRWVLVCVMLVYAPSVSAQDRARFDVLVRGIKAGTVEIEGRESGGRYTVQGAARSSGLVGEFVRYTVSAASSGRVQGNTYRPSSYTEIRKDRGETVRTEFRYGSGGLNVRQDPPDTKRKSYHAGPSGMGRALDPLTGVWALLRDRPRALACDLDAGSYNGRTLSRLRLTDLKPEGDRIACPGIYTRQKGFSAEEMAERVNWPFTVFYQDTGGPDLRVVELQVPTTFGLMRVIRK